jgi:hypothetical protein
MPIKLTDKEICDKWLVNKNINPITSRKIKETGDIYKKLEKKCLVKKPKETSIKSPIESSNNSFKTAKSSFNISNNTKINAYKKIYKLFVPYIKRTSFNISDRINYFILMKKYIMSIKEKNNCFRLYNIEDKKITYRIGNKIILDKQIGSKSKYGIVYLSHFKTPVKYGNKYDKLNKFAVKITDQDKYNTHEKNILKLLTKEVIQLKCPHFPISYGFLKCRNTKKTSNNSNDYSIVKDKQTDTKLFPDFINNNKSLIIQINELASGDLNYYLENIKDTDKLNAITQILLSIIFFHNSTKSYHNDCHQGNFLFHKIKPGGYFHYNIYDVDYYLENQGYLWVIWDFGFTASYNKNTKPINFDFVYMLKAIDCFRKYFTNKEFNFYYSLLYNLNTNFNIKDYTQLYNINKEILEKILIDIPSFTTVKPNNIINKQPYIIKKDLKI